MGRPLGSCGLCGGFRRRRVGSIPVAICDECGQPVCLRHFRFVAKDSARLKYLVAHDHLDPELTLFLGEKICAGCGRWRSLSLFSCSPLSRDGYANTCASCVPEKTDQDRNLCTRCLRGEPGPVQNQALAVAF